MKALNLFAGLGGNRKLWQNVDVTAVEIDPDIANIYSHFYPDDTMVIGDAHEYLLNHYLEFDFIWSSPPCPSHSRIRKMGVQRKLYPAVYPDIKLWEEIVLLQNFCESLWVVENVVPYYKPIIEPMFKLDRHLFWSNFYVPYDKFVGRGISHKNISSKSVVFDYDLTIFTIKQRKDKLLRNMVNPEVGKYILDTAIDLKNHKRTQGELF